MQSVQSDRKRNQRKSPLTPKKSFRKEDSPPAVRVGGRVKKAKIPFDPSDAKSVVTKRRQTDPPSLPSKRFAGKDGPIAQQHFCCYCKKFDKPEVLVTCKAGCSTRIHLSCLQSICENFGKNEEQSWECIDCQTCTMCNKGIVVNGKQLLKCYVCFSYYHSKCHGDELKIKTVKENRFCCGYCEKPSKTATPSIVAKGTVPKKTRAFSQTRVKPNSTDNKFAGDGQSGFLGFNANEVIEPSSSDDESNHPMQSQSRLTGRAQSNRQRSSVSSNRSVESERPGSVDDDVCRIDASNWSADQVYKYFRNLFPRHAHVFRDHEIDGRWTHSVFIETRRCDPWFRHKARTGYPHLQSHIEVADEE